MDPTMPTENQFQLAFIELGFGLIELFFNVVLQFVFPAVAVPFFENVIDVIEMIIGPFFA